MGILNVTPDSFYDGGVHLEEQEMIDQVGKMLHSGAAIIDIGGYSSRPG
ncbi:MAG: dihydropteroate synthase, partial [Cyclobacteriaceae bacterium]